MHMAKASKVAISLLLGTLVVGGGLSGCSVPAAKTAPNPVTKSKPVVEQQLVIINKQPAQNKRVAVKTTLGRKDKHHIEYEKKRLRYNQKWLAQQEAKQQQQRQKYHEQYQLQQQQKQQQAVPYYGHTRESYASVRQLPPARVQQQRRARVQQRPAQLSRKRINLAEHLSRAAIGRTRHNIRYDGRYIPIAYPMGDVPANMGVCTDVIIRSYRSLGIDLQRLVHEDMSKAFYAYPNLSKWGLSSPDPNIDHRRVHNLRAFFTRHAQRLPVTRNPWDYRPGDIVTWSLGGDQGHIGIVVNRHSPADPNRYMIVHNISSGTKMEDVLFNWPITGHFRYFPDRQRPWLASAK